MKKVFHSYTICMPLVAVIICLVSIYAGKNFTAEVFSTAKTAAYTYREDQFNSLVPGVFILQDDSKYNKAVGAVFESVGYDVREGSLEEYMKLGEGSYFFLVSQKAAEALNADDADQIIKKVRAGGKLMTWGRSSLSEKLGLVFSNSKVGIDGYIWRSKRQIPISFKKPAGLEVFSYSNGSRLLAEDKSSNPVMISGKLDKGSFIYSGIPLVSSSGSGHEHYPYVLDAVREQFGMMPAFSRDDLAIYVDIDYHKDEDPALLANRIRSYGANQVNISAWYDIDEYGYIYEKLIEECHRKGITVFAWFELPYVSEDFWNRNPQWREKTAAGEDAHIDWRRLMALDNPEAMEAVKQYVEGFVGSYDWDGVDIAEIYYESPGEGFENAGKFTPMNDSFRKSFRDRHGIDPREIFDKLSQYYWKYNRKMKQSIIEFRVELITRLHEELLMLCEELKQEKEHLQTVVTAIDSIADKDMREKIGVDASRIVELQYKYHFMLQIEDPYTLWNLGPDRYRVIGEEYRSIMSDRNQLSIDINVIDRGGEVYPTRKQRGVELYQLVNTAGRYADKVILYSLATLEEDEMGFVPYSRSGDIEVREVSKNEYIFEADKGFTWRTAIEGKTFYIDGEKWPFVSEKGVMIPGGEHRLKVLNTENEAMLLLETVNGEISDVSIDQKVNFSYASEGRFFVLTNTRPSRVVLDGTVYGPHIMEDGNKYTVILPKGVHRLSISTAPGE